MSLADAIAQRNAALNAPMRGPAMPVAPLAQPATYGPMGTEPPGLSMEAARQMMNAQPLAPMTPAAERQFAAMPPAGQLKPAKRKPGGAPRPTKKRAVAKKRS